MKMTIRTMMAGAAVLGISATATMAANIGVIDMEKLIKMHPRTAADRVVLEQYVEDFETEREQRVTALKALSESFDALRKGIEDVSLSEKATQEKRQLAQAKLEEMREAERELRELANMRQKELTGQELRMRTRVVSDIRQIVSQVAATKKLDLVLDSTGPGAAGYSPVIYSDKTMDITEDVTVLLIKESDKK
ncbi:MAG TPA: hypothetical protein DCS43_10385 [Verrucomicrobia bacterium]|nr:hypothetical protein [Verrucomicrobiota bacterium]